jgi:mono/diheme cytochrome c family protein
MMRPSSLARPLALAGVLLAACGPAHDPQDPEFAQALLEVSIPEQFRSGEALYNANCVSCHGPRALGTDVGPPLVHIIYETSHHSDIAFYFAVDRGVRAHHWNFGDMPPVPGLANDEVGEIIAYIRWLQRQVGIH